MKNKKPKSISKLKKKLDAAFSKYIRAKYAINGICYCYTCNKPMEIKKAHAGHFISRNHLITRWDERNVKVQCPGCNLFGGGKPLDFEENLRAEYGDKVIDEMKASRHTIVKMQPSDYERLIQRYTN